MVTRTLKKFLERVPRIEIPPVPHQHRDTLLFVFAAIPAVEVLSAWGRMLLFVLLHGGRP